MIKKQQKRAQVGLIICHNCGTRPQASIGPRGVTWSCKCGQERYTQRAGQRPTPGGNDAA